MDELTQSIDEVLERAYAARPTMQTLEGPPYNWDWPEGASGVFAERIAEVNELVVELADAEAKLSLAASLWDQSANAVYELVSLGQRMGKLRFKGQRAKLKLFERLRLNNTGRESRQQQALAFEASWKKADPAWVFKEGLALGDFRTQRRALRDLEEAHADAVKDEMFTRASLHEAGLGLHDLCVDWYEAATLTFAEDTVPGMLVRTVPTTYDPNRPPGPLVFTRVESTDAGEAALRWRAPRGSRFVIESMAPGSSDWTMLLNEAQENSWTGQGMPGGFWKFRGQALNKFGEGAWSEPVELAVPATKARAPEAAAGDLGAS